MLNSNLVTEFVALTRRLSGFEILNNATLIFQKWLVYTGEGRYKVQGGGAYKVQGEGVYKVQSESGLVSGGLESYYLIVIF